MLTLTLQSNTHNINKNITITNKKLKIFYEFYIKNKLSIYDIRVCFISQFLLKRFSKFGPSTWEISVILVKSIKKYKKIKMNYYVWFEIPDCFIKDYSPNLSTLINTGNSINSCMIRGVKRNRFVRYICVWHHGIRFPAYI